MGALPTFRPASYLSWHLPFFFLFLDQVSLWSKLATSREARLLELFILNPGLDLLKDDESLNLQPCNGSSHIKKPIGATWKCFLTLSLTWEKTSKKQKKTASRPLPPTLLHLFLFSSLHLIRPPLLSLPPWDSLLPFFFFWSTSRSPTPLNLRVISSHFVDNNHPL